MYLFLILLIPVNATKIEILVIDPVRFIVDNQIEFKAENQEVIDFII